MNSITPTLDNINNSSIICSYSSPRGSPSNSLIFAEQTSVTSPSRIPHIVHPSIEINISNNHSNISSNSSNTSRLSNSKLVHYKDTNIIHLKKSKMAFPYTPIIINNSNTNMIINNNNNNNNNSTNQQQPIELITEFNQPIHLLPTPVILQEDQVSPNQHLHNPLYYSLSCPPSTPPHHVMSEALQCPGAPRKVNRYCSNASSLRKMKPRRLFSDEVHDQDVPVSSSNNNNSNSNNSNNSNSASNSLCGSSEDVNSNRQSDMIFHDSTNKINNNNNSIQTTFSLLSIEVPMTPNCK